LKAIYEVFIFDMKIWTTTSLWLELTILASNHMVRSLTR